MKFQWAAAAAACLALSACAGLPAKEAGVFRTYAAADRDAFVGVAAAERTAVVEVVSETAATGDIPLTFENCNVAETNDSGDPCIAVYATPSEVGVARTPSSERDVLKLSQAAPKTRALIGALADYGEEMATLAEAADIAEAKTQTAAVGTAVTGLLSAVGAPPVLGPIIDLAVWGRQKQLVEARREALLQAARKADPGVKLLTVQLRAVTTQLKRNLISANGQKLANARLAALEAKLSSEDLAAQLKRLDASAGSPNSKIPAREALNLAISTSAQRARTANALLLAAADALQAARNIPTDYSRLEVAHTALLEALEDPDTDLSTILTGLAELVGKINAVKTAAQGT